MKFKGSKGWASGGEEVFTHSLTSLIYVIFLLLIFFMVSTVFVDFSKRLDIQLPETKAASAMKEKRDITIEIDVKGRIYLDGKGISKKHLEEKLKTFKGQDIVENVMIRADKRIPYGEVIEIMGICHAAKIESISVAVK
ncbi:MAG: biopolymer transporter ExbD [Nitrospinota bacterium]